jgi:serine/threonine protein kinase
MTPEEWQRVRPILESALELAPASRPAFLDRACADAFVRREVESLIASHELRSSFLESPAVAQVVLDQNTASAIVWTAGMKLGPYEIQSLLGAGGMGEVYRARDTRLERTVAIKVLPAHLSFDPVGRQRFEREARAIAALQHSNICTLYDVGHQSGTDYLVMEYLEGETLAALLAKRFLPLDHTLRYGIEVADALDTAHRHGIVHRDLKPGNILVTAHGECKVLDFGLAKLGEEKPSSEPPTVTRPEVLTGPGQALGTVAYMSPEQARGEELDARTDLFSFGAVLYEMATGKLPFSGKTSAMVFKAILDEAPAAPTQLNANLPERLDEIVAKALEKDRDLRYQSAADLRTDLKRLKRDKESGRSTAAGSIKEAKKPVLRRAIVLGLAAIALLSLTVYWWNSPVPVPRVLSYTQITHDGHRKHATGSEQTGSVTDGPRVFFTEGAGYDGLRPTPAQVSSDGGETVPLPVPFEMSAILDISPSGSDLLVESATNNSDTNQALWAVPALGGSPRRLANVKSLLAAWSPDGKKLVYAQGSDLYLANTDGTDPHKLVTVPGIPGWVESYIPGWPRWSPDARRIRFSVQDPQTLSYGLWEVSADGSNLHPLLPGWNNPPAECCGVWTPDGRYFVFQSTRNGRIDLWAVREKANLFERASGRPVQLTAGPMSFLGPNSSRDGTKLFTLGIQSKNELVRYDAGTKQLVRYLSGISAEGVDFSKGGQWVTYVAIPQGTLWRSKPDGSERIQLSFPPLQVALPRWSPDGRQIVFMGRLPPQLWQIYVVPAEGGSPQQLVSDDKNEGAPDWSPSGSQLVFSQFPELGSAARDMVIHRLDLRTHQVSILPGSEGLYSAHWSSDGRFIAASTVDNSKLMASELATRKWTMVSQPGGRILGWSRNDEYIYYENNGAFYRTNFHRGYPEQVASLRGIQRGTGILGFVSWAALAPDDSVLLMREASSEEIYALALEWP